MKTTIQIQKYPKIIKLFLDYPSRNFTPLEISKNTEIPYATTWRYIQNLREAGIISVERIGKYNVCRLNKDSPMIDELKTFVRLHLSPHWLAISEFLKKIRKPYNLKKIILFGSVARGEERLTSDIDIAIITRKKDKKFEERIAEIVSSIAEKSKMNIIPVTITSSELEESKQFRSELEKGKVLYERNK